MGDLSAVLTNWGEYEDDCEADIDGDGWVEIDDLSAVLTNSGQEY
jgi:hypothetical protein